jgi:hypothetical protein
MNYLAILRKTPPLGRTEARKTNPLSSFATLIDFIVFGNKVTFPHTTAKKLWKHHPNTHTIHTPQLTRVPTGGFYCSWLLFLLRSHG